MKFRLPVFLLAVVAPGVANAMPVNDFIAKADALEAKGMMAMFSGDLKTLTAAIKSDANALKAEREAAKAANRTPAYCPPGPVKMGSKEIFQAMRAVPPQDRPRTDTRDVLRAHLAKQYPCSSSR